jgi:catechol 2,3-dioxygenase-like lactoylglutathione lyase family enzyme
MKMSHAGIMVEEMARAVEFYTQALGLDIVMDNSEVIEEHETAIRKIR